MPSRSAPGRHRGLSDHLGDLQLLGFALLGGAITAAGFGFLIYLRAVPEGSRPLAGPVWLLVAVALTALGAAFWLFSNSRPTRRHSLLALAAGLILTLLISAVSSTGHWRSIAGHPDNAPSTFYAEDNVDQLLQRLVEHAGGRPILGIYLSNHYESSVIVPLVGGPSGSSGGEIISELPDGEVQVVQTKLSPGIAAGEGLDTADLDPAVIAQIAAESAKEAGLDDRDEVRVQAQRRDGVTAYDVMTRKRGVDQPWLRFDLDGERL